MHVYTSWTLVNDTDSSSIQSYPVLPPMCRSSCRKWTLASSYAYFFAYKRLRIFVSREVIRTCVIGSGRDWSRQPAHPLPAAVHVFSLERSPVSQLLNWPVELQEGYSLDSVAFSHADARVRSDTTVSLRNDNTLPMSNVEASDPVHHSSITCESFPERQLARFTNARSS